jgi:hypothetical protein
LENPALKQKDRPTGNPNPFGCAGGKKKQGFFCADFVRASKTPAMSRARPAIETIRKIADKGGKVILLSLPCVPAD